MEIRETEAGILLKVKAVPNAGKSRIMGIYNGMLKVKVAAVPEDGKANEELERYLAEVFKAAKSKVSVIRGSSSREKTVLIKGATLKDAERIMEAGNG